jgi:FtsP/CotA-like multicopper oxidase with cupredoxin domain
MNVRRTPVALAVSMISAAALVSCTTDEPATPAPSAAASSPVPGSPAAPSPSSSPATDAVTIDISISNGRVNPNGSKIDVKRGQNVVLNVTSDQDDEIHVHTSDGYELEVKAGKAAQGKFVVTEPGRFEIESHHLEKIIVILNVR